MNKLPIQVKEELFSIELILYKMQFSNELSRLDKSQRDKQHPNNKKLYLLVAILEIKGADGIAQMVNMLQKRKLQKRDCLGKIHLY
ncbi:hypothetical protein [Streptococcus intermedius]